MKELEVARRDVALLLKAADAAVFALPRPAASLLPAKLRDIADDVLRARDDDEFSDAVDRALEMPEFVPSLANLPRLKRDRAGELVRLRHALGDEAGEVAALGQKRLAGMAEALSVLVGRSVAEGREGALTLRLPGNRDEPLVPQESTVDVHGNTLMSLVYADLPVEFSMAILALGRALVCWLAIVRADESGRSVPACLRRPIAETYARGAYPALQLLASVVPVPEDLLPASDVVNFADSIKRWFATRAAVDAAADRALTTGERMCGEEIDPDRHRDG